MFKTFKAFVNGKAALRYLSAFIALSITTASFSSMIRADEIPTPGDDNVVDVQVTEETPAISETSSEVEVTVPETVATVDENVTSIPTDETTPETTVVDEIETVPIEETVETTVETTEPTSEVTEPTETTAETTETVEDTVAGPVQTLVVNATDNTFADLIADLPSSNRLIVYYDGILDTSAKGVFFGGVYYLAYESVDAMESEAYRFYAMGIPFAFDGDATVCGPDDVEITEQINPNAKTKVALIDTGSKLANESYSVIGDDLTDKNGHGTTMANSILAGSNDAYIISIKTMQDDGTGNVSDICAAVQMATEMKVDIIFMALSFKDSDDYEAFKRVIKDAQDAGITIIASAGNNSADASKYLPAGLDGVITVGAITADGYKSIRSNYGSCVNYYIVEEYTSNAAAIFAGKYIAGDIADVATSCVLMGRPNEIGTGEPTINSRRTLDRRNSSQKGAYVYVTADDMRAMGYTNSDDFRADIIAAAQTCSGVKYGTDSNSPDYYPTSGGSQCLDCITYVHDVYAMVTIAYGSGHTHTCLYDVYVTSNQRLHWLPWHSLHGEQGARYTGSPFYLFPYYHGTGCTTWVRDWVTPEDYSCAVGDVESLNLKAGDIVLFSDGTTTGSTWGHAAIFSGTKGKYYECSSPSSLSGLHNRSDAALNGPGNYTYAMAYTIEDFDDETHEEYPYFGLSITKCVTNTRNPMYGAIFTVYSDPGCSTAIGTLTDTNNDGIYDVYTNLQTGEHQESDRLLMVASDSTFENYQRTVYVKETGAPSSFKSASGSTYPVSVNILDPQVYAVTVSWNSVSAKMTYAVSGAISYDGSYSLVNAISTASAPTRIDVANASDAQGYLFYEGSGLRVSKNTVDGDGRFPVNVVTFKLYNGTNRTGTPEATATYDSASGLWLWDGGIAYYPVAVGGTYTIVESYPDVKDVNGVPYSVTNTSSWTKIDDYSYYRTITVPASASRVHCSVSASNVVDYGSISLQKDSNDGVLAGHEFKFYYIGKTDNNGTGDLVATKTTDANGQINLSGIATGFYRIVETETDMYKTVWGSGTTVRNNAAIVQVTNHGTATVSVDNDSNFMPIKITKVDSKDSTKKLTGAIFQLYADTNGNGKYDEGTDKVAQTYVKSSKTWVDVYFYESSVGVYETVYGDDHASAGVQSGTYFVIEQASPEGYQNARLEATSSDDSIKVVIPTIKDEPLGNTQVMAITVSNTEDFHTTALGIGETKAVSYAVASTITDRVYFENLIGGKEYTLTGRLMCNVSGEARVCTVDGTTTGAAVVETVKFKPESATKVTASYVAADGTTRYSGYMDVEFTLNTTKYVGATIVAFETLSPLDNGDKEHADINDVAQTLIIPEFSTSVKCNETGTNEVPADTIVNLTDTVTYKGLVSDGSVKYVVRGFLYDKEKCDPVTDTPVATATPKNLTPTTADGTVDIVFENVNSSDFGGKVFVVYEYVYAVVGTQEILVGRHVDKNDTKQTLYTPDIGTSFGDIQGNKTLKATSSVTLVDTVEFKGLDPTKTYVLKGKIVNQTATTDKANPVYLEGVESVVTIKADPNAPENCECKLDAEGRAYGTAKVEFTIDASLLEGVTLVAFEDLDNDNITVAFHHEIDDYAQSVYFPKIGTTLVDRTTNDHISAVSETAEFADTVAYENLLPGTYTLYGVLKNKLTGETITNVDGTEVVGTTTFTIPLDDAHKNADGTPKATSGTQEVVFTLDTTKIKGITAVAFEYLYEGADITGRLVEDHEDINDVEQTIEIPEIKTTLVDKITNTHTATFAESVVLVDHVSYTNLIPGKEYTMSGVLMDAATGKEILKADGTPITASQKFTPDTAEGIVDVEFTINTKLLVGVTRKIVAFETCSEEGKEFAYAIHADINDNNQTVDVPTLITNATFSSGAKTHPLGANIALTDTLSYTGLAPNRQYVITTVLMVKHADGSSEVLKNDGKEVTATTIVTTPAAADGEFVVDGKFTVTLTFNAEGLNPDKDTVVVFEDVYDVIVTKEIDQVTGKEIETKTLTQVAEHHDINDKDQTVGFYVQTGVTSNTMMYVAGAALSILVLSGIAISRLKRKQEGEA